MSKQSIEITGIQRSKLSSITQEKTEGTADQEQDVAIRDVIDAEVGPLKQISKQNLPAAIQRHLLALEEQLLRATDLEDDVRNEALSSVNEAAKESKQEEPRLSKIIQFVNQAIDTLSSVLSASAPIIRLLKEIIGILK